MTTALIVVDVQNDFCEGGSLAVEGGHETARKITEFIEGSDYELIVATRDQHIDPGDPFSDKPDYVNSWPPHCVENTEGADFSPELGFREFDAIFPKGRFSAAYSGFEGFELSNTTIGLDEWLREQEVDAVEIVGIATDHCVRATALDAAKLGYRTSVLLDLTAAVSPDRVDDVVAELEAAGVEVSR